MYVPMYMYVYVYTQVETIMIFTFIIIMVCIVFHFTFVINSRHSTTQQALAQEQGVCAAFTLRVPTGGGDPRSIAPREGCWPRVVALQLAYAVRSG